MTDSAAAQAGDLERFIAGVRHRGNDIQDFEIAAAIIDEWFPRHRTVSEQPRTDAPGDVAKRVVDALWPVLGGNHTDADTWTEISEAVEAALSHPTQEQPRSTDSEGLADELERLISETKSEQDDIDYYTGGSRRNYSGEKLLSRFLEHHETILAALRRTTPPTVDSEGLARDLELIQGTFSRWIDEGPDSQPAYKSGIRPFSTGDLKHMVRLFGAASAALRRTAPPPSEVEKLLREARDALIAWTASRSDLRTKPINDLLTRIDAALSQGSPDHEK